MYVSKFNSDGPVAYFITIRCYGTWLPGDERGSMDRKHNNKFGEPRISGNQIFEKANRDLIVTPITEFNTEQKAVVHQTVIDVCDYKKWVLHAVSVQSNHAHIVVSGRNKPELMMNTFKSRSTINLREKKLVSENQKIWARHGSTKWLWTDDELARSCYYVTDRQ